MSMDLAKATEIIDDFTGAIRTWQWELGANKSKIETLEKQVVELARLREEVKRLKDIEDKFKRLSQFCGMDICPHCFGEGHFVVGEDEYGQQIDCCNSCEGTRFLPSEKPPIDDLPF